MTDRTNSGWTPQATVTAADRDPWPCRLGVRPPRQGTAQDRSLGRTASKGRQPDQAWAKLMNRLISRARVGQLLGKAAVALLLVWAAGMARAQDWVRLAWDPNSEPDLGGYIVYYGVASRVYTNAINVGNVTTNTVTGLVQGVLYYFAVTAYNTNGLESDFSDEVTYLAGSWSGRRLSVRSANPGQGVSIALEPPSSSGQTTGLSPFDALYASNVQVRLTAPALAPGSNRFDYWVLNGTRAGTNTRLTVTMDRDHIAEAVYRPALTLTCAPPKTVPCGTTWDFDPPTAYPDSNDVRIIVQGTITNMIGAAGTLFTATRTWLATNSIGERVQCSQAVTVRDISPPSLVCAPDKTVKTNEAWGFDMPIATDACGPVSLSVVTTLTNAEPPQTLQITRVWQAIDQAGNRTQCSQTVTVLPSGPPPKVLEVIALGTDSPVPIVVSPEDSQGLGRGLTPFVRSYSDAVVVTVIAPETAPDGRGFAKWQRNGLDWSQAPLTQLLLDTNCIMAAVYAPPNDRCAGAVPLTDGVAGGMSTAYATATADPVPDCASLFGGGVWFSFSPTQRGRVIVSTCSSDDSFDTVLQVFRGGCDVLEPVACNNDNGPACPLRQASLVFDAEPGSTYLILAGGWAGATGNLSVLAQLMPMRLLNVAASGITAPIQIAVGPTDINGLAGGTASFSRLYTKGTVVTLSAPALGPDGEVFAGWQLEAQPWSTNLTVLLQMDTDHWVSAMYDRPPPPVWQLTVNAAGPDSDLVIALAPPDQSGAGSGRPPFSRLYRDQTVVTLTAPLTVGSYRFLRWQRNGQDLSSQATVPVRMESHLTLTAVYGLRGPIVWWKLDETTGTRAADSSGSRLDGWLINGPSWTAGLSGQALRLDGYNDFMSVPMASALDCVTNQFTVALWVRTTNTGPQALIEKGNLDWRGLLLLALNRPGLEPGGLSVFDGRGGWVDSETRQLTDGAWHHLAVSYDGAVLRLYCDGRLDTARRTMVSYAPSLFPLSIGRLATDGLGWWFQGWLDDIRWYDWALPESELARLGAPALQWTQPNPPPGSSPLSRPRIARLQWHPALGAMLYGIGQPGQSYQIRVSTNLTDWRVIGTETAGPDGLFAFQDTAAPHFWSRFYQVVRP